MSVIYHDDLIQGSDEWLQIRCGLLTASEMKHILTPTLKVANNDKTRAHAYELAFQRITQYVEPQSSIAEVHTETSGWGCYSRDQ